VQKKNIELLPDLYSNFAQFIYAVRTKYFAMNFKYAMPISVLIHALCKDILEIHEMKCAACRLFILCQTCIHISAIDWN